MWAVAHFLYNTSNIRQKVEGSEADRNGRVRICEFGGGNPNKDKVCIEENDLPN
jgi:hypothetical protein